MSNVIIHDCDQGSSEWRAVRCGVPTASNFAKILAQGEGKTRRRYLLDLVSECLTGEVEESYTNGHMERGHRQEDDARQRYAFQFDAEPMRIGFMRLGRIGASPDSLIGDDGLLEIKTKLGALHLEVLEAGKLPSEHVAQVQGQLLVSGRQWCDFVSYRPRLPLFCIRVQRDEAYIAKLEAAIAAFLAELDAMVAKYRGDV